MKNIFPGQVGNPIIGKVRNIYNIWNEFLVCYTTNRISAFDVVFPVEIPFKGALLNLISTQFMKMTEDIIPNCLLAQPHPNIQIWKKVKPIKIEVIVRSINTGSYHRNYTKVKKKDPWGYPFLDLRDGEHFPEFRVTPTTKVDKGHDEDISVEEIIKRGIVSPKEWDYIEEKAMELFELGEDFASQQKLILVDTKYEFGRTEDGTILLIDEVHTPDSSRYFYKEGYEKRLAKGKKQRQLSKEFLREWLNAQGFTGDGEVPKFSEEIIQYISDQYLELYERLGLPLEDLPIENEDEIFKLACQALEKL
ncbi:MAG: phosphoribosylaminoimidazolesuccinocarboxamide synthase [Patescibacteria group bacterium]|nr:phosphoribosylaminoimidazolesuccinocarboxamide synthase [Patescibacteria group bacterium]